jgi:hypothetical protein
MEQECETPFNSGWRLETVREKLFAKIVEAGNMFDQAEDIAIRNLVEALERLHQDLDRVELWTAALGSFQTPAPEYQPGDRYLLQPSAKSDARRS